MPVTFRRAGAACALVLFIATLLYATPAPPAFADVADLPGRTGVLSATDLGFVVDVEAGSRESGARVMSWPFTGFGNQNWTWEGPYLSDGYFVLMARHSSKCLDVQWGSRDPGALVWQWSCDYGDAQLWKPEYFPSSNAYQLRNRGSGMCLTMPTAQQQSLTQQYCGNTNNQHFRWSTPIVNVATAKVVTAAPGGPIVARLVPGDRGQNFRLDTTPVRDSFGNVGYRLTAYEVRTCLRADSRIWALNLPALLVPCDPAIVGTPPRDQLFILQQVGTDGVVGLPLFLLHSFINITRCLSDSPSGQLLITDCNAASPAQHFRWT